MWYQFYLTRFWLVAIIVFTVITMGCSKPDDHTSFYTAEDQAKEKRQSLVALKSCFFSNYMEVEHIQQPAINIAKKIRSVCEVEFRHLRAVKLNYAPVPDIHSPPQRIQDEEISLVTLYVLQNREKFESQTEFEKFKKFHRHNPATISQPEGI